MTYGTGAEAWPQLAAIPRNSRTEPLELPPSHRGDFSVARKRSLLAKKMDCRVISAFTRVFNALCPAMTRRGWDQPNRLVGLFHAVATGRAAGEKFYGKRGTSRKVAHWCWRNELYDPLSSFVPELEPRRRRGFSFGSGPDRRKPQPALCRLRRRPQRDTAVDGAGRRDQDVWPGSRSGEVSFLLSSVIIAVRGRPF
jgi:hypothetical protein